MDFDENLVEEIKNHPNLYDVSRLDFKDPVKREKTWRTISENINIEVKSCQVRWQRLRERYARERKKQKTASRAGGKYEKPWEYFEAMNFLDRFVRERKRGLKTNNYAEDDKDFADVPVDDSQLWQLDEIPENYDDVQDSQSTSGQEDTPSVYLDHLIETLAPNKKFKQNSMNEGDAYVEKQLMHNLASTSVVQEKLTDEDELFGLSVAATLRKLNPRSKALAKCKIQQVLFDVEFSQEDHRGGVVNTFKTEPL